MTRRTFKTRRQNRFGMALVGFVVLMIIATVSFGSFRLKAKQDVYRAKITELEEQKAAEEKRTEELEELRRYTQTNAYIEEVAKEKLGLVHPDEIIFKIKR